MNLVTVRRISQVFFLTLFLWLCAVMVLGERGWELRGWPVNWFLQLDPLVAIGTLVTTGTVYRGLLWALAVVVPTILLGRFFCGWVCPFGTLHQGLGYVGRRHLRFAHRMETNTPRRAQVLKVYILIFLLAMAAWQGLRLLHAGSGWPRLLGIALALLLLGLALYRLFDRQKHRLVKTGAVLLLIGSAAATLNAEGDLFAPSLQTGLLDPIPLMHRSVNLSIGAVANQAWRAGAAGERAYEGAWLIGTLFIAALLLNFVIPRFYCRFICPLGALLGLIGRPALWRIGKTSAACADCRLCAGDCEGACDPMGVIRTADCVLCFNCTNQCRDGTIRYRTAPSAAGEQPWPALTRRGVLMALGSGLLAAPLARLSRLDGANYRPNVLRPPGALPEGDFLARCIKCGQCMQICPTNIIQPALLQAGIEGLWTPVLNYRIGTSGCALNCVACGNVCPTAAIRPLSLDAKQGRGAHAAEGPVRMGLAFVDHGRCLPWAMRRPCIVCQEVCPVTPKAIYTQDEYVPARDGHIAVSAADDNRLQVAAVSWTPGQWATGDYVLRLPDGGRRTIRDNTVDSLELAAPADPPAGYAYAADGATTATIEVRLQRPVVDPARCIGCGICEHECPVSGLRAIRVTAENETRHPQRRLVAGSGRA